MTQRATYAARVDDGMIVIEDQSAFGGPTVTNDVEAVVQELAAAGFDLALPIIYRDLEAKWDGIQVISGAFARFVLLGVYGEANARAAMIEEIPWDERPEHWRQ